MAAESEVGVTLGSDEESSGDDTSQPLGSKQRIRHNLDAAREAVRSACGPRAGQRTKNYFFGALTAPFVNNSVNRAMIP